MQNNHSENSHIVDLLFVLGLFLIFTVSALFLVLIGSGVYQNTVTKMNQNFDTRTSCAYVTEKLRQNDCYDAISIGTLDGQEALILTQQYGDSSYCTYLYVYNGYLKELFTSTDNTLTADAGQDILPVSDFQIRKVSDSLYELNLKTPGNESYHFFVSTHCSVF